MRSISRRRVDVGKKCKKVSYSRTRKVQSTRAPEKSLVTFGVKWPSGRPRMIFSLPTVTAFFRSERRLRDFSRYSPRVRRLLVQDAGAPCVLFARSRFVSKPLESTPKVTYCLPQAVRVIRDKGRTQNSSYKGLIPGQPKSHFGLLWLREAFLVKNFEFGGASQNMSKTLSKTVHLSHFGLILLQVVF